MLNFSDNLILVMEIEEFICELLYYVVYKRPVRNAKKKRRKEENQLMKPQIYRQADVSSSSSKIERSATTDTILDYDDSAKIEYGYYR